MERKEQEALQVLREKGYAIAVFYPMELEGVKPSLVEEAMVRAGFDVIDDAMENSE